MYTGIPAFALGLAAWALCDAQLVLCAHSFAGSNLYYAAGLYPQDRYTLLRCVGMILSGYQPAHKPFTRSGLQSAGMKVLRVWLDGQSETQKVRILFGI